MRICGMVIAVATLIFTGCAFSHGDGISSRLNITEADGSPSTYPYKAKFSNGTVTDNGDGTVSITNGGGGGSPSLPFPAGATNYIQLNPASQQAGTLNVSNGEIDNLTIGGAGFSEVMAGSIFQFDTGSFALFGAIQVQDVGTALAIGGDAEVAGALILDTYATTNRLLRMNGSTTVTSYDLVNDTPTMAGPWTWTSTRPSTFTVVNASTFTLTGVTFSTLGSTAANGTYKYCSDCTVTTAATCTANLLASCVCAGSGPGAFAKRLNAIWYCD